MELSGEEEACPGKPVPEPRLPRHPTLRDCPALCWRLFDTNDRINHYLIENLPAEAWNAKPPDGKGRTIAAIVAHMHNVRVMWLKAAKAANLPGQLDRATVTAEQALRGLASSRAALSGLIEPRSGPMAASGIFAPMWPAPSVT